MRGNAPQGLTLIETALALLALGIVAWLLLAPLSGLIGGDKRAAAKAGLNAAKDALLGHALAHQVLPETLEARNDPWNGRLQFASFGAGDICAGGVGLGSAALWTLEYADGTRVPNLAFVLWSNGPNHAQELALDSANRLVRVAGVKDDLYVFVSFPSLYKLVCQPTTERAGGMGEGVDGAKRG